MRVREKIAPQKIEKWFFTMDPEKAKQNSFKIIGLQLHNTTLQFMVMNSREQTFQCQIAYPHLQKDFFFFFLIKQKDFIETKQQKTKQRLAQSFFFNYNSKTKEDSYPNQMNQKNYKQETTQLGNELPYQLAQEPNGQTHQNKKHEEISSPLRQEQFSKAGATPNSARILLQPCTQTVNRMVNVTRCDNFYSYS